MDSEREETTLCIIEQGDARTLMAIHCTMTQDGGWRLDFEVITTLIKRAKV